MADRSLALVSLAVVVALWQGTPVAADALRCGARLVSRGDTTSRVASICGEPSDVIQRTEFRTVRRGVGAGCVAGADGQPCAVQEEHTREVVIEEWTYDFGPNKLVQRLTFEDGVLVRIDSSR